MKPITQFKTILLAFSISLITACKEEVPEPQLPPYTQEGKNIFACKINGEIYIAEGIRPKNQLNSEGAENNYRVSGEDTLIYIYTKETNPKEADISLDFIYTLTQNSFELNHKMRSVAIVHLPVDNYILAESRFTTTENDTGWVKVNYFQNKILAGTFEFTAIDDRGELVHVTEGRFDLTTNQ